MAKTTKHGKRGRSPLPETERKDRLIQTRVAEDLDATLREEARKKRVSVSQLIRNVLEDTFDLVDNIVGETTSLAQTVKRDAQRIAASARGERTRRAAAAAAAASSPTLLERVQAWQEVMLNRDAWCARCGRPIAKGAKGFLGLHDDATAPPLFICHPCGVEISA